MAQDDSTAAAPDSQVRRVRAFDVRTVIGLLLGIYGVVLVVTGLVDTSEAELAKSDGVNVNLWAGIGLVVAALVFLAWVRLRPLEVPVEDLEDVADDHSRGPGHH
jgi:drug/metabolite transporter (DMT)-like permease